MAFPPRGRLSELTLKHFHHLGASVCAGGLIRSAAARRGEGGGGGGGHWFRSGSLTHDATHGGWICSCGGEGFRVEGDQSVNWLTRGVSGSFLRVSGGH